MFHSNLPLTFLMLKSSHLSTTTAALMAPLMSIWFVGRATDPRMINDAPLKISMTLALSIVIGSSCSLTSSSYWISDTMTYGTPQCWKILYSLLAIDSALLFYRAESTTYLEKRLSITSRIKQLFTSGMIITSPTTSYLQ